MTATTELLALLREAADYVEHSATCEFSQRLLRLTFAELADTPTVDRACTCGMRLLMVRVEDALANHPERPESSTCLPRRAIKVANTGKDDGDDDGN